MSDNLSSFDGVWLFNPDDGELKELGEAGGETILPISVGQREAAHPDDFNIGIELMSVGRDSQ